MNAEYRNRLKESFIEIEPLNRDGFLTLRETLTRIGMPARRGKGEKPILWQSVHVLHSQGHYYLVHFKEMFLLDGRVSVTKMSEEDYLRKESIAHLLQNWGMVKLINPPPKNNVRVKVIQYDEKDKWDLRTKYEMGLKRGQERKENDEH